MNEITLLRIHVHKISISRAALSCEIETTGGKS
jgi:hypothetical protein